MKKILNIGWKDLVILFTDRGALILMLGAPFVLTLGLGLVTGAFSNSDNSSGLADVPVAIVNGDNGQMGAALVDVFLSDEVADLVEPVTAVSESEARQQVDDNVLAAAVLIPSGFTNSLLPDQSTGMIGNPLAIEVYANPARPISAGVVSSIVKDFVNRVETGLVVADVTMTQLVINGRIPQENEADLIAAGTEIGERFMTQQMEETVPLIQIQREAAAGEETADFNLLAYLAPAMAVLFLMYTVTLGGRSILTERDDGTLARLLVTPTSIVQVLGGKVVGIFLGGAMQVGILIAASSLLFGLRWGAPLGVLLLIVAVALAATGWGLLVAAIARKPNQVSSIGTAMMLTFGILGGSFGMLSNSGIMALLSKITPNAWAIEGFTTLASGGALVDILPMLLALLLMAAVLFVVSVTLFRRRSGSLV